MRDSFKCEFLFLGSAKVAIERDVKFQAESISIPIPDNLQKRNETKVYIPYEFIKNIMIFHPELGFKGNHQFVSYVLISPSVGKHHDLGTLFKKDTKCLDGFVNFNRRSDKLKEKEIVFQLFLTANLRYEFNQNLSRIEAFIQKNQATRKKAQGPFVNPRPNAKLITRLKNFLSEHNAEPPPLYFKEKEKNSDAPSSTPRKTKPVKVVLPDSTTQCSPPVFFNNASRSSNSYSEPSTSASSSGPEHVKVIVGPKKSKKRPREVIELSDDERPNTPPKAPVPFNEGASSSSGVYLAPNGLVERVPSVSNPRPDSLFQNVCSVVKSSNSGAMFGIVKTETENMSRDDLITLAGLFCDRVTEMLKAPFEDCAKDESILRLKSQLEEETKIRKEICELAVKQQAELAAKIRDLTDSSQK